MTIACKPGKEKVVLSSVSIIEDKKAHYTEIY